MWTDWGVLDAGPLIHSLGCTYFTALGQELGYAAVCEAPAPRPGELSHVEEDVRSDTAWFDRETQQAVTLVEFERYADKQKDLTPKLESLLLAQQRWAQPEAALVLAYWSIGLVTVPDHRALRRVVRGGFTARGGVRVPGNPRANLLFWQFIVRPGKDGLMRLDEIVQRGES